jgi:hypothetical protein
VLHIGLRLYLVTQTTLSHGEELEQAITVVGRGSGSGGHSQRRGGSGVVGRRRRGASRGADRGRRQVSQNGEVAVGAGFGRPSGGPKAAGGGGGAKQRVDSAGEGRWRRWASRWRQRRGSSCLKRIGHGHKLLISVSQSAGPTGVN